MSALPAERSQLNYKFISMREVFNADGWHSRGYLPHFDGGEISQFITFRLADSLPQRFLDKWREELKEEDADVDAALRRRIEIFWTEVLVRVT